MVMTYRALRRVLIVVHDDFPGLSNLVNTFFPHTDDQICTVHLLRNLKKELSPEEYKFFNSYMKTIKNSHSYELGSELFDEACEKISRTSPAIADRLISKKEKYLAFLKYPYEVRPSISSTNLAKSISGGYFHSMDDLKAWYIDQRASFWQMEKTNLLQNSFGLPYIECRIYNKI